jgi:putative nucleotidyltransferase with HDIG domain
MNEKSGKTAEQQAILAKIDQIRDLPTIPHVLLEINRMLVDPDISINKLKEVIEKDQAITAKILRLVNSSFYGMRTKIVDISQALVIMGFGAVRNSLAAVSVIDIFRTKQRYDNFDIRDLWKHSIAVAMTSRYIAEKARMASPHDCFVAGLLHDIGKLIMEEHLRDIFGQVLALQKQEGISFFAAENRILRVNHAMIGAHLVRNWRFPNHLVDAIEHHHEITKEAADFKLSACIFAANTVVNHQFEESGNEEVLKDYPEYAAVMERLGNMAEWRKPLEDEIEQLCQAF